MIGVRVREQNRVDAAEVVAQRLRRAGPASCRRARAVPSSQLDDRSTAAIALIARIGRIGRPRSRTRSSARRATSRCRETARAQTSNASISARTADMTRRRQRRTSTATPIGTGRAATRARAGGLRAARAHHGHAAIAARVSVGSRADARSRCGRSCSKKPTRRSTRSTAAISTALRGELGDVLFQCVFHAQIARRGAADSSIADAIERDHRQAHPPASARVHADRPAADRRAQRARRGVARADAVLEQWEQLKAARAGATPARSGASWPACRARCRRCCARTRSARASPPSASTGRRAADVVDKIDEEVRELREALEREPGARGRRAGRSAVLASRTSRASSGSSPKSALRAANDKFTARFDALEARVRARGPIRPRAPRSTRWRRAWTARQGSGRGTRQRPTSRPLIVRTSHAAPVGLDDDRAVAIGAEALRARRREAAPSTSGAG